MLLVDELYEERWGAFMAETRSVLTKRVARGA
jgi:hypothetical protein